MPDVGYGRGARCHQPGYASAGSATVRNREIAATGRRLSSHESSPNQVGWRGKAECKRLAAGLSTVTSSSSLVAIRRHDGPLVLRLGQPALRWFAGRTRAEMVLFTGRIEEAERLNLETLRLGKLLASLMPASSSRCTIPDPLRTGAARRTGRAIHRRHGTQSRSSVVPGDAGAHLQRARQRREAGRAFAPLAASRFADLPLDLGWLKGGTHCAQVAAHLGDVGSWRVLNERLAPTASSLCPVPP